MRARLPAYNRRGGRVPVCVARAGADGRRARVGRAHAARALHGAAARAHRARALAAAAQRPQGVAQRPRGEYCARRGRHDMSYLGSH